MSEEVVDGAVRLDDSGNERRGAGVLGAGARAGLLEVASLQLRSVSVTLWFACVVLLAAASPVGRPVLHTLVCLGVDSGPAGGHGRPA
jgi:hypothetical protein